MSSQPNYRCYKCDTPNDYSLGYYVCADCEDKQFFKGNFKLNKKGTLAPRDTKTTTLPKQSRKDER